MREEAIPAREIRRVLIYRLGSLGDMVVALPCLHLVARAFPKAERRMLTNVPVHAKAPAAAAVLDGSGLVHGYLSYVVGTRSPVALLRLWWTIWRWRPEVVVYLAAARGVAAARRDAWFFRLCGVRRLVGVPLTEALQVSVVDGEVEPEAARLGRCVAELGDVALEERGSWDFGLSDAERWNAAKQFAMDEIGQAAIAVSVGTKVQAKDWGKENWRSLLAKVAAAYPDRLLMLIGAADEYDVSEYAASSWRTAGGGPVVNLCGKLTPRESAAALQFSVGLFLGHDSGPMHLAAAVGTRVVAVFAARNLPRQWYPYGQRHRVVRHSVSCEGCGLEVCVVEQKRCLTSITVDEVLTALAADE